MWASALTLLVGGIIFVIVSLVLTSRHRPGAVPFGILGFLFIIPGVYASVTLCGVLMGWRGYRDLDDIADDG